MEIKEYIDEYYKCFIETSAAYESFAKSCHVNANTMLVLCEINNCRTSSLECTIKYISDKLILPKQTVSAIIKRLAEHKYIKKVSISIDKREKNIELTPIGITYAEDMMEKLYKYEEHAFISMSEEERAGMAKYNRIFLCHLTATAGNHLHKSQNLEW